MPACGQLQNVLEQELEAAQGSVGIRCCAQKVGELFGEEYRELYPGQNIRIVDFSAPRVDKVNLIFHPPVDGSDSHMFDGDVVQGQGVGQGIEEGRGILGDNLQTSKGITLVLNIYLDRKKCRR